MQKLVRIGFLSEGSTLHERLIECFTKAAFSGIRVQINFDQSMATFRLGWGTHSRVHGQRQVHACVLRLLRAGGFKLNLNDLSPIAFRGDEIEGAFCPVRLRVSAIA